MKVDVKAVADVYAAALLEVARTAGQQDEVVAELADLIVYMDKNPDVDIFLTSASINEDARHESLEKLFRGKMNELLLNLVQVLNHRRRTGLLRAIQRRVQLLMIEQSDQQEVFVDTAVALTDDLRSAIRQDIRKSTGKDPVLVERLKPDLIGGMVLRIGDMQIDGSVATRIRLMQRRLQVRASQEIHKIGRYVAE